MHNIKDIRANLENFVKTISKRNHKVDQSLLQTLDTKNRDLIQKKENLEKRDDNHPRVLFTRCIALFALLI